MKRREQEEKRHLRPPVHFAGGSAERDGIRIGCTGHWDEMRRDHSTSQYRTSRSVACLSTGHRVGSEQ
eukprot:1278801-Rhodomonas_salina.1